MPVAKRIIAIFLALLLPMAAAAESAVEVLPTSAPMPVPEIKTDIYTFQDLAPFYEQYKPHTPYKLPALTETEKQRLPEAWRRIDAGEKPEQSILNLMENVTLSLIQLPAEQYEGEEWYLILPRRELRDTELLQLADAFREAGVPFDPDMLTWRNCMRGGAVTSTRSWKSDESDRYTALGEQFFRTGLRPTVPYTAAVPDDGIGVVTLADPADDELFDGLESFDFFPARRLTDDELLSIYTRNNPVQESSPDEINNYERLLRQELTSRLGMPLSAVRSFSSEYIGIFDNYWGDTRRVYSASFDEKNDSAGRAWRGDIDISTGTLINAAMIADSAGYSENEAYSDVAMDPWDPHWSDIAAQTVSSLCANAGIGISQIRSWGESTSGHDRRCAVIRATLTDGAVCEVFVSYLTDTVLLINYYDAKCIALLDDYNIRTYGKAADGNDE